MKEQTPLTKLLLKPHVKQAVSFLQHKPTQLIGHEGRCHQLCVKQNRWVARKEQI